MTSLRTPPADDGSDRGPGKWPGRRSIWIGVVVTVALVSFAVFALHVVDTPASAPSCSWPKASFQGGNASQRGVVRCYLRALASHSAFGMKAVMNEEDDDAVDPDAFLFSREAAAGITHVSFKANDIDSADVEVDVVFVDGHRDVQELHIADPTSATDWRFTDVGSHTSQSYVH